MKARFNNWSFLAAIAVVTPMAVSVPDSEHTYRTTIILAGGSGTHGTDLDVYLGTITTPGGGCEGPPATTREIRQPIELEERFKDVGGGIDHQVQNTIFHIGIRGGYIWEEASFTGFVPTNPLTNEPVDVAKATKSYAKTSCWYINPYWALEGRKIGMGIGLVRSEVPLRTDKTQRIPEDLADGPSTMPSFHIRFGPRDRGYVSYSLWEGIPIYSGGGMHNAGIGFALGRQLDMWTGFAFGGPYQRDFVMLRATLGAASPVAVRLSLRVPSDYRAFNGSQPIEEIGGSVGLQFRW